MIKVWQWWREVEESAFIYAVVGLFVLMALALVGIGIEAIVHAVRAGHMQTLDANVGVVESISGSGKARTIVHTSRGDIVVGTGFSAMHGAHLEVQADGNGKQYLCLAGGGGGSCVSIVGAGWRARTKQ